MTAEILKFSPKVIHMAEWERAARQKLHDERCPECEYEGMNHRPGCSRIIVPDLKREKCPLGCGFTSKSLGCRGAHRPAPEGPEAA